MTRLYLVIALTCMTGPAFADQVTYDFFDSATEVTLISAGVDSVAAALNEPDLGFIEDNQAGMVPIDQLGGNHTVVVYDGHELWLFKTIGGTAVVIK